MNRKLQTREANHAHTDLETYTEKGRILHERAIGMVVSKLFSNSPKETHQTRSEQSHSTRIKKRNSDIHHTTT